MINFFIYLYGFITGWEGDQRYLCKTVAICCGGTDAEINNSGDYSLGMRSPRIFFFFSHLGDLEICFSCSIGCKNYKKKKRITCNPTSHLGLVRKDSNI